MVVGGKAVVFSVVVGVSFGVRVIPKPNNLSFSASSSSSSSSSTDNQQQDPPITTTQPSPKPSPSSSFRRLKVHQVKALIHRIKHNSKRTTLQHHDDDDHHHHHNSSNTASATAAAAKPRSPSQSKSKGGWEDSVSIPNKYTKSPSLPLPLPLAEADNNFFSLKSFKDIGCTDNIIQSLHNLSLTRPSHIQAISFSPVTAGKSCIIADQSGSGKTLAYLVPVIQRLRQQELQGRHKSSSQAPTVIILAPTAELASQVSSAPR